MRTSNVGFFADLGLRISGLLIPLLLASPLHAGASEPFLHLRDAALGYHGPQTDVTNLAEIRIGWFGPTNLDDPLTGDLWWAANHAIREANEQRGCLDHSPLSTHDARLAALPFRLVPRWAVDPWGSGVSQLTRMVYDEQPLALLGSADSASTHLAEQVVAKANLPLVSPIATDQSVTLAGVSWMFSCAPSDAAIARVLVDEILVAMRGLEAWPEPDEVSALHEPRERTEPVGRTVPGEPAPDLHGRGVLASSPGMPRPARLMAGEQVRKEQEPPHEPHPLTPSLSPSGGEGARRAGEGDSVRIMVPRREAGIGAASQGPPPDRQVLGVRQPSGALEQDRPGRERQGTAAVQDAAARQPAPPRLVGREPILALLTGTDHESRMTTREVLKEFSRRGRAPDFRFEVPPGARDIAGQLTALHAAHPDAVLILAGPEDAARLVRAVRERLAMGAHPFPSSLSPGGGEGSHRARENDWPGLIFGSHAMGRRRFLELAGPAAEGVRFPLMFVPEPTNPLAARFTEQCLAARGHVPDYTAALTYDATRLLLEAIRRAGPNRARIREALHQLSPWPGVAGLITFDGTGQNTRANLGPGTIRHGVVVPCVSRAHLSHSPP